MSKRRATVADHTQLRKVGTGLFGGPGPASVGIVATLWPNGTRSIWVKTADNEHEVEIVVSDGPAGMAVSLRSLNHLPLTLTEGTELDPMLATYASVMQYKRDDRSQAFKRWYQNAATAEDVALLGPDYQRKKGA